MSDEKDKISKSIRQAWRSLHDLGWEGSKTLDLTLKCLAGEKDTGEPAAEQQDQLAHKLNADIAKAVQVFKEKEGIDFNEGSYYVGGEMSDFVGKWHDTQKDFWAKVIKGCEGGIVDDKDRRWFINRINEDTEYLRGQIKSIANQFITCISSRLRMEHEGKPRSGTEKHFPVRLKVKEVPQLKSADAVLKEIELEDVKRELSELKGKLALKEVAANTIRVYTEEISRDETEELMKTVGVAEQDEGEAGRVVEFPKKFTHKVAASEGRLDGKKLAREPETQKNILKYLGDGVEKPVEEEEKRVTEEGEGSTGE